MSRPKLLIYDDGLGCWGPMTHLRPIFACRTAINYSYQRIERALGQTAEAFVATNRLLGVVRHRLPARQVNPGRYEGKWLAVNGRWLGLGSPDGVACELEGKDVPDFLASPPQVSHPHLISRPWHVLDHLEQTLIADLDAWDGPRIAKTAVVHPSAVIDESLGPVVLDEHVTLEPLAVIQGPAYVGPHTILRSHAHIRPHTVLGPQCRVGGEVSFSIIQGYSNKPHLGFLGHALVGRWVNLAANTNCSNLKNTYGHIRVQLAPDLPDENSGRIFLGPVIGDYVRTAIGTRINTGCVLGTGSMIALTSRFTPKCIPAFTFLTDVDAQPYQFDKFLAAAHYAMGRREVELPDVDAELLRHLAPA